jgi:hypothetical protein
MAEVPDTTEILGGKFQIKSNIDRYDSLTCTSLATGLYSGFLKERGVRILPQNGNVSGVESPRWMPGIDNHDG